MRLVFAKDLTIWKTANQYKILVMSMSNKNISPAYIHCLDQMIIIVMCVMSGYIRKVTARSKTCPALSICRGCVTIPGLL